MNDKEKIMYEALHAIRDAETSHQLKQEEYGLPFEEALEMAYDNVKMVAGIALEQVEND